MTPYDEPSGGDRTRRGTPFDEADRRLTRDYYAGRIDAETYNAGVAALVQAEGNPSLHGHRHAHGDDHHILPKDCSYACRRGYAPHWHYADRGVVEAHVP